MEKLEAIKKEEEERITHLERETGPNEFPVSLSNYQAFLVGLSRIHASPEASTARNQILQALIHQIKITSEGFELEYRVGRDHIERGLAATAGPRPFSGGPGPLALHPETKMPGGLTEEVRAYKKNLLFHGLTRAS